MKSYFLNLSLIILALTIMSCGKKSTEPSENRAPAAPSNPSPANGATNVATNLSLIWQCSDPDGDTLAYDIYFGLQQTPSLLFANLSYNLFQPDSISFGSIYYWRIVAKDRQGGVTSGQIWSFTTAQAPIPTGQIAFATNRGGEYDIYIMNADGSNQHNLTNNPAYDTDPSWSPDGTQIAFKTTRGGNEEIYIMNADGSNQQNISQSAEMESEPSWSPNGQSIAYVRAADDSSSEIWVMSSTGENKHKLTNNLANDHHPSWSPTGTQIVFVTDNQVYVMNADGSNVRNISNNNDSRPSWSPNGMQIVFVSHRDGNEEIYVMNSDGSDQHNVSNNEAYEFNPCWSPDGMMIAFETDRDLNNNEIYVMNLDGSDQHNISDNPAVEAAPAWCPIQ